MASECQLLHLVQNQLGAFYQQKTDANEGLGYDKEDGRQWLSIVPPVGEVLMG